MVLVRNEDGSGCRLVSDRWPQQQDGSRVELGIVRLVQLSGWPGPWPAGWTVGADYMLVGSAKWLDWADARRDVQPGRPHRSGGLPTPSARATALPSGPSRITRQGWTDPRLAPAIVAPVPFPPRRSPMRLSAAVSCTHRAASQAPPAASAGVHGPGASSSRATGRPWWPVAGRHAGLATGAGLSDAQCLLIAADVTDAASMNHSGTGLPGRPGACPTW